MLSFHRPCQTQALTCSPRALTILTSALTLGHTCPSSAATLGGEDRAHPASWVCAAGGGARTYLHLSSFVLLQHEAEDVRVRPGK